MSIHIPLFEVLSSEELFRRTIDLCVQQHVISIDLEKVEYIGFFDAFFDYPISHKVASNYVVPSLGMEFFSIGYECAKYWETHDIDNNSELSEYIKTKYVEKKRMFSEKVEIVSKLDKSNIPVSRIESIMNQVLVNYIIQKDVTLWSTAKSQYVNVNWWEEFTQVDEYERAMFQIGIWYYISCSKHDFDKLINAEKRRFPYRLGFTHEIDFWKYYVGKIVLSTSYQTRGKYLLPELWNSKSDEILEYIFRDLKKEKNCNFAIDGLRLSFFAGMLITLMHGEYNGIEQFYKEEILKNGFFRFEEATIPQFEKEFKFSFREMQNLCLELSVKCMQFIGGSEQISLGGEDLIHCADLMYKTGIYIVKDLHDIRY